MENLDNYNITGLFLNEVALYTKKLVKAFDLERDYEIYLDDNIFYYAHGYNFLVARHTLENEIIGGICLESKPKYRNEIFIEHIFVDEEYRNQGVATSLLEYIVQNKENMFKMNKIDLYLFCEEYVKQFYLKNKFYETDTILNDNLEKVLRMDRKI